MRENYKLKYTWHADNTPEGYTKDDIKTENDGLCDAMILISILYNEDGSYSQVAMSADGRSGTQLDSIDMFRAWSMLGMQLSEDEHLTGWHKTVTENHSEIMRGILKEIKENKP